MTTELLLKDLSARLPYGVKCEIPGNRESTLIRIEIDAVNGTLLDFGDDPETSLPMQYYLSEIKPYLFPLSSMIEEQIKEFDSLGDLRIDIYPMSSKFKIFTICSKPTTGSEDETEFVEITQDDIIPAIDWLNKNHFDYRGLIGKGLAIDATNLNIY